MNVNLRRDRRRPSHETYTLCCENGKPTGRTGSLSVAGLDISASGIRVCSSHPIPVNTIVFLESQGGGTLTGYCKVRHCTPHEGGYAIGLEFSDEAKATLALGREEVNYYEFLQISPKADMQTIHRIYRIMAGRFHPDNPETGDPEQFMLLQAAYDVLTDPQRRAEYDARQEGRQPGPMPIFELREFLNGIEGETNRRLGILALLYNKRRTSPHSPGVSLLDLETRMGIPREYLDFTVWYLKSKQYITVADSSDYSLTALGVDFVESSVSKTPILERLLQSGPQCATSFRSEAEAIRRPLGAPLLIAAEPPQES